MLQQDKKVRLQTLRHMLLLHQIQRTEKQATCLASEHQRGSVQGNHGVLRGRVPSKEQMGNH